VKGRPTKFTPDKGEAIAQLIEVGNFMAVAAQAHGIHPDTLYAWLKRGREAKRGEFREFYLRVVEARARAEARMVTIITLAAERDWRAAAFLLERRDPRRWAALNKTVVAGDAKRPLHLAAVTQEQAGDELLKRLDAMRERFLAAGQTTIRLVRDGSPTSPTQNP
jgi:transposase-like protein